jgi:hypothetical protein
VRVVVRTLLLLTAVALLLSCGTHCGSVFVGGAIQNGTLTVHGSVTNVQLGNVVSSSGGTLQVTFVTFLQSNVPTTIGFCSNQTAQFPLNQTVSVNFTSGEPCATLIVVVVA